jgi:hypothetical protein
MATAPTVPDFSQFNFELNDTAAVITKQNGVNAALAQFGNSLTAMTDSINADLQTMEGQKTDTQVAAQAASTDAQQVALDKNAVASDRTHVDQQKQAIDNTAGQVDSNAQQVALDTGTVATNTNTATQAATDAGTAKDASIQAKNDAQALYGDLAAVDAAKTDSQQAATLAGQERTAAETARTGAETAQGAAETAAGESQQAVTDHVAALDPHSQYAKEVDLGEASTRGVVGGDGDVMAEGFSGLGGAGQPLNDFLSPDRKSYFYSGGGSSAVNTVSEQGYWPGVVLYRDASDRRSVLSTTRFGLVLRNATADTWESPHYVYDNKNIVGTVSQSGGVPTGAIFERGSNSNGNYIKFADGTLKTWQEVAHLDTAVDVAVGPIFRSPSFDCPPYPHAFVARPVIATDYRATNGVNFWGSSAGLGDATRAFDSYRFFNPNTTSTAQLRVCISATGRWY